MRTALLIIDVQNALCFAEYADVDSRGLIERINPVSAKARAAGAPVILIQDASLEGGALGRAAADGTDEYPRRKDGALDNVVLSAAQISTRLAGHHHQLRAEGHANERC
ncbi:isochorismatase family protein [Roseateles oligotrophus]|uniref:Isochorismatase family protein n=1 Tax=Roseateles oligotrophus TaxID=1769250 RepID=A0ABT2YED3_9BURK|nr:isochorismatase family protein [Roseateles oligotrophus]MCV2368421.1 isochorismatase family protein [Roseateles oligotrophus]